MEDMDRKMKIRVCIIERDKQIEYHCLVSTWLLLVGMGTKHFLRPKERTHLFSFVWYLWAWCRLGLGPLKGSSNSHMCSTTDRYSKKRAHLREGAEWRYAIRSNDVWALVFMDRKLHTLHTCIPAMLPNAGIQVTETKRSSSLRLFHKQRMNERLLLMWRTCDPRRWWILLWSFLVGAFCLKYSECTLSYGTKCHAAGRSVDMNILFSILEVKKIYNLRPHGRR